MLGGWGGGEIGGGGGIIWWVIGMVVILFIGVCYSELGCTLVEGVGMVKYK